MKNAPKKLDYSRRPAADNWFNHHPVATIGIVLPMLLCIVLLSFEVFLKTFSGLGNPVLYQLNPLYGYRPLPNQVIEPRGGMGFLYASRVTTNNLGLRAAGHWSVDPSKKILFLGDSVTYGGQYVADEQLFSSVAGRYLPTWQVGNGGVNAWGVENIVGLVMDYDFVPAEVVVTCVIEGDFYRGQTRAASLPLWTERPRFALQDLLMFCMWKIDQSRYTVSVDSDLSEAQNDKIVDRAVTRLKKLDNYLGQLQTRHIIFILPTRDQVVNDAPVDSRVRHALSTHQIDAIYLLPVLRTVESATNKRRKWFHDTAHLEPAGHKAYGTLIGKILAEQLLQG